VRVAAELHDVGKLALPEGLLLKPEPLDDAECKLVKEHTLGERIVSRAGGFEDVARTVRSTHERWDGGSYPDGLAGEVIPIAARIIAISDAYDAMTSDRPYRRAMSPEAAVAELCRTAGSQFDPTLVAIFIKRVLQDGRPRLEAVVRSPERSAPPPPPPAPHRASSASLPASAAARRPGRCGGRGTRAARLRGRRSR
jgi:HD-GYP domain-containing protein (c-di-GMP phosphodiesterase class II)